MMSQIFIAKDQINQCIKRSAFMLAAFAACRFVQGCGPFVPNLSSWLSSRGSDLNYDLISLIFSLSPTILPFHLLGLNGLIGAIDNFFEFKLKIGP